MIFCRDILALCVQGLNSSQLENKQGHDRNTFWLFTAALQLLMK